ncbi:MAG: OsmC family protein [Gammaproteobacteria bacterium]|nr:OsmC family protein [Gammaproteobacteria bacterium]NIR98141.1 OsmC family protein [Gammaproteobacteria bacterium]NIT62528.1 OsmC family protein [Gammaproteobacteria bacterium]NIV20785.1 OsmC family peroxiredoxin [Gammaproteobacteria bacterium]NIY31108.1 OsmC family peroxiredoxin [Gammaproteobacteria bacterium]
MPEEGRFTIYLQQLENYEFRVHFDWDAAADLLMDEAPPLGRRRGPNASRLLAAATANCLSASLLYCLNKAEVPDHGLTTSATCTLVRNDKGRLRIGRMEMRLELGEELSGSARLERCPRLFEDFCVVTASLREGIAVEVEIADADGRVVYRSAP